jgi:hypothetical protein
VGGQSHAFSSQELLHWQSSVLPAHCHVEWTSTGSAIIPDVFGRLSSPMLQNLPVVMLVNRWAGGTNSWWTVPSQSRDHQCAVDIWSNVPFGGGMDRKGFTTYRTAVWFRLLLRPSRGSFGCFWLKTNTHRCFCLSVSSGVADLVEMCGTLNSSIRIRCHVSYESPNLPAISEMALCWTLLMILQTFSMFSSVRCVEGWPESPQSSTKVCLHIWINKTT